MSLPACEDSQKKGEGLEVVDLKDVDNHDEVAALYMTTTKLQP